jgi:ferritin-like metal-binding protein YciE
MLANVRYVNHAEEQVSPALQKIAARSDELGEALEQHHDEIR